MAVRSWAEIGKDYEIMNMMSCAPKNIHKLKSDFVFDENKSVKWNREKVEENNRLFAKEVARLNTEKNKFRDAIYEEIYEAIQETVAYDISRDKARYLWSYAYIRGHDFGFNEIIICLDGAIELANAMLAKD